MHRVFTMTWWLSEITLVSGLSRALWNEKASERGKRYSLDWLAESSNRSRKMQSNCCASERGAAESSLNFRIFRQRGYIPSKCWLQNLRRAAPKHVGEDALANSHNCFDKALSSRGLLINPLHTGKSDSPHKVPPLRATVLYGRICHPLNFKKKWITNRLEKAQASVCVRLT